MNLGIIDGSVFKTIIDKNKFYVLYIIWQIQCSLRNSKFYKLQSIFGLTSILEIYYLAETFQYQL